MTRRLFVLAFASLFALSAPARADVAPQAAIDFVTTVANEGLSSLNDASLDAGQKRERVSALIRDRFDLQGIAQFVIGRYFNQLTEAQKDEFSNLYFDYVMELYFSRLINVGQVDIAVDGVGAATNGDALVTTQFARSGRDDQPLRVIWRIRDAGEALRISDIQTEGVSLAVTQRSEFTAVYRSKGYEGLIQAMRQKIAQNSES